MRLIFYITLLCFSVLIPALSQKLKPNKVLTIDDALYFAFSKNPHLLSLKNQIDEASARPLKGLGLRNPEFLFMKEGIQRESGKGFVEKRQTISQSLDFPVTGFLRMQRLGSEKKALEYKYEQEKIRIKAAVKKAYTQIVYTIRISQLRERELSIAEELNRTAVSRFEAGDASEMELLRTEIQKAEAKNDVAYAKKIYHEARYELFKLIGLDPEEQQYGITFPDTLVFLEADIAQEEIMERLEEQPGIISANRNISAAISGVREAWSSFLPDLSLSLYRQDYGFGYDFYGFEIGFSIPLWFFSNEIPEIRVARAQYRQAITNKIGSELEMKKEIEDAWHAYHTSREIVDRYQEVIKERSEKLLEYTLEGYRLGEVDLIILLDNQRTYLNSIQRFYDALRDYYMRLIDLEKYLDRDLVFNYEEN